MSVTTVSGRAPWNGQRWRIVAAVFLCEMLAIGSTSYAFGLFVEPLQREFRLSRAEANSGLSLLIFGMAIAAPCVGWLLDRLPLRRVLLGGAALMAAGLFTIAASQSLPAMALALIIVAAGATAIGPLTAASAVTAWFERDRSRALGITAVGTSMGGTLILPLLAFSLGWFGWRAALVAQGLLIALVVSALALTLIDDAPNRSTATRQWRQSDAPKFIALLRTRNFWCIGLVVGAVTAVSQSLLASLIPYATDRDFSVAQGSVLVSTLSFTSIFGKLILGSLGDRLDKRLLLGLIVILLALGLLALRTQPDYIALVALCALTGFVLGGELPIWAALAGDCFDRRHYGAVMGAMTLLNGILGMVLIRLTGESYDRYGHYGAALDGGALALFVGALLIAGIRFVPARGASS